MDSYQKYARDVFGGSNWHFRRVSEKDMDEVKVAFALMITGLDRCDNFRIYPLWQKKEYFEQQQQGCCGNIDSQIKCKSGNIYWIGCNYGH